MQRLALVLLGLGLAFQSAFAAPPTADQQREFRNSIRRADAVLLLDGTSERARKLCEAARSYAARFDANDFWSGVVEFCFAQAAENGKNKSAACAGHARVLTLLAKAPRSATLDAYVFGARTNEEFQQLSQDDRRKLGC